MQLTSQTKCDHRVGNPIVAYKLSTCPRCLGEGVYGGFAINTFGKIDTVNLGAQLSQSIKKILTERKREGSLYGFDYGILRGGVIDQGIASAIIAEVSRCLSYLRTTQQREKALGVTFRPSELLKSIDTINIEANPSNPLGVVVSVTVLTEANSEVSATVPIRR